MAKLQYVGGSHVRTISFEEFEQVGVDDAEDLVTTNGGVVEVSDGVAEYLVTAEPTQWKEVDDSTLGE